MNKKIKHLILLTALVAAGGIVCLYLKVNYLTSIVFFLIIPSLYLSLISKGSAKKAAVFSLAMLGIPLVIDGILILNNAWLVQTMFSFKVLSLIPVEDFFFSFFSLYLIVMLYEYFTRSSREEKTVSASKNLAIISIVLVAVFLYLHAADPGVFHIPYAYASVFFFAGCLPVVLFLFSHPRFLKGFSSVSVLYFFFAVFYEIVALKIGVWSFPGTEYISRISFLGVQFPLEEFLFFLIALPAGVLTYYEFFTQKDS